MEEQDLTTRRFSREGLLKLGAAAGAAAVVGGPAAIADAARSQLAKESGRLQVLDWVGYEVKQLYGPYLKKYPGQKPNFTLRTNGPTALGNLPGGLKRDFGGPYVGYVP